LKFFNDDLKLENFAQLFEKEDMSLPDDF